MGLFQSIKDASFLSKCVTQIKHVLPDSDHLADEFCITTQPFLLAFRDKGADHGDAVNMVCLMILDRVETFRENDDSKMSRGRALVTAGNYCASFAERWPSDKYSSVMMQAASAFASYMRTHQIKVV